MTDKCVIYPNDDGGVSTVYPTSEYVAELMANGMTEDEAIAAISAKDIPTNADGTQRSYEIVLKTDLPDRKRRHLWRWL
jgi:uncharacterized protein YoaH (UPF0181 family)